MKIYILCFLLIVVVACKETTEPENQISNESDQFSECNEALFECINGNGSYCLFGFKWGEENPFTPAGYNAQGPEKSGGQISLSFQENNGLVNTHSQVNLPSKSFDSLIGCAKAEIRKALSEWEANADIEFVELPENSQSDIRFFVADIRQSGVGYPNYNDSLCLSLAGNIVIKANNRFNTCETFYLFMLHEIGHALGLGHVSTSNIMSPNFESFNVQGLQPGDIQGLKEIYGEK